LKPTSAIIDSSCFSGRQHPPGHSPLLFEYRPHSLLADRAARDRLVLFLMIRVCQGKIGYGPIEPVALAHVPSECDQASGADVGERERVAGMGSKLVHLGGAKTLHSVGPTDVGNVMRTLVTSNVFVETPYGFVE
jgi:hypothetical protein